VCVCVWCVCVCVCVVCVVWVVCVCVCVVCVWCVCVCVWRCSAYNWHYTYCGEYWFRDRQPKCRECLPFTPSPPHEILNLSFSIVCHSYSNHKTRTRTTTWSSNVKFFHYLRKRETSNSYPVYFVYWEWNPYCIITRYHFEGHTHTHAHTHTHIYPSKNTSLKIATIGGPNM